MLASAGTTTVTPVLVAYVVWSAGTMITHVRVRAATCTVTPRKPAVGPFACARTDRLLLPAETFVQS